MKIAVLISGEYREFPVAHKLWNFLKWSEVDSYFVTWDKTLHVDKDRSIPIKLLNVKEEDILSFITPKKYKILEYSAHKFTTDKKYSCGAMIFLWKEAIKLMEESNITYDFVIMLRPDIGLQYEEDVLYEFFEKRIEKSDEVLYAINSFSLGHPQLLKNTENLSDLMFVGTQNAIIKLKKIPLDSYYNLESPNIIDTHKFLAKECSLLYERVYNLPVEDWCIVRSNSHLKFDKTFDEYKEDSKDWWETYYNCTFVGVQKNLSKEMIKAWRNS